MEIITRKKYYRGILGKKDVNDKVILEDCYHY